MCATPSRADTLRDESKIADRVAEFCRDAATSARGAPRTFGSEATWRAMVEAGTALWLDSGDLDVVSTLWTREFSALTTNNTLLNNEVQKGIYDELVPAAAVLLRDLEPEITRERLILEIAFILNAVHGLKLVDAFDADVSVELHTALSRDADASVRFGRRFHAICPDRFIVKVPLTPEGIIAARRLGADRIRVNFTLGFSARQNQLIAFVARPSYVNVFMGRINAFFAKHGLSDGRDVGEKATLASQRQLRALNRKHGLDVRQIGASVRSGEQCRDLAGLDVLTIPTAAAKEFLALGLASNAIRDRTANDPDITPAAEVDLLAEGLDVFWRDDENVAAALDELAMLDVDDLDGPGLVRVLAGNGAGNLFPPFDAKERARIAADGKIPELEPWRDRTRAGSASWDGLFTEAALASFTADQAALDDRIARFV